MIFYANAILREDEINCWIRGHEFDIDVEDIGEVLGFKDLDYDFAHYKDRILSIETVQSHIGGVREGRCLNTTAFPADMKCLTTIMMFCNDPAPTVYILSTLGPRTPHGFVLEILLQSHSSFN